MKKTMFARLVITLAALNGRLSAQSSVREFVPFKQFMENAKAAYHDPTRPGSRVKDVAAFEEMRQHVLTMYRGIEVTHSFVLDSAHFDCIPAAQQPSLRILGLETLAPPPPQSVLTTPAGASRSSWDREKTFDPFGNSVGCESDSVPMRRMTIEDMTRFPTLNDFFAKGPDSSGRAAGPASKATPAAANASHKYSYMKQVVDNIGGNSSLNIWKPSVNTSLGEQMSLSQEWYTGGSAAALQTAEVGWQVQPGYFNTQNPVLFVYYTANNYGGQNCYNLTCGAFVQYPGTGYVLGASLPNYSTVGGTQAELSAFFYLYQGNWYLAIDGTWIGYYPVSVYHGGQLSRNAQTIMYGSESAGTTVWPAEGSGQWSNFGFQNAAYQRNVYYLDLNGNGVWASLTPEQPSPSCYSTSEPLFSSSPGWGVYFFEGGPGGSGC